jgi:ribose 5-phosphate isomerase B
MKIAIGSDHAGFRYKEQIKKFLNENGHEFHDFGTHSDDAVDYPLYIRPVAEAVARGEYDRGIILGGSGNGEAMVANRIPGIRCALCWNLESALFARKHNDSNMLSLGERMISPEQVLDIVKTWLETPFDGGRHLRRIKQIDQKQPLTGPLDQSPKSKRPSESHESAGQKDGTEKPATEKFDLLISFRYIKYIEGKNSLDFKIDPGLKTPSIIHIPSPESWNSEVPEWAQNRRKEILDRVKPKCSHLKCEWREY